MDAHFFPATSRLHVVACLLVSATAVALCGAAWQVELAVQESAGVDRTAAPISGGVPLPDGQFKQDQAFSLVREDGTPVACQVSPLVVNADDSLRWILLDFQDDVAAGETAHYVLKAGSASTASRNRLSVRNEPGGVHVDTGPIALTISKSAPFGLFSQVTAGGEPVVSGGRIRYVQLHGPAGFADKAKWQTRKLTALAPESVKLHHAGPLRVTIEVKGRFADDPLKASYRAWITAWAGHSRVGVKYKLCNSHPDQYTAILVGRSAIELELAAPVAKVQLGAKQKFTAGREGWMHQGLFLHHTYQDIPGSAKAGSGDRVLWTANGPVDRPAGWIAAHHPARSVFARDHGQRRNWWRAVNCRDEPTPGPTGMAERFTVTGVPSAERLYFAVRGYDDANNRSELSNVATAVEREGE